MATLGNRIRDWSRSVEQALGCGVEIVRQVAGGVEKTLGKVPGLGRVAALFRRSSRLSASLASASAQRGLTDSADEERMAKQTERRRELELKISLERMGPGLSR